ncbi:YcaO-like family protein [Brachybacterium sp. DNPG3]
MSPDVAPAMRRLIDRRTGLLTELEAYASPPEWPRGFRMIVGHVADTGRDGTWPSDRMSTGMGFVAPGGDASVRPADPIAAAAVGEALERYCGNFVPAGLPSASWSALADRGIDAIDPQSLLLYSAQQHARPGFPFLPLTRDLPVRWTAGTAMRGGGPRLVPASLVFPNFHATRYPGEPRTNATVYAGLAAGSSRRRAETSALEEIIERDAVEVWWRAGGPAIGVPDERIPGLRAELEDATGDLEFTVLAVPNRWRVPVVAVVVHDAALRILAVGTAARPRMLDAARKAAAEAVSLRSYSKGLLDADGGAWLAVDLGLFGASRLAPFRADRRYLDSFAPDLSDMHDLCCNSQYYLDPRALAEVDRLRRPERMLAAEELPDLLEPPASPEADDLRELYLDRLAEAGVEPVSIDLTTGDVEEAGFAAVRVIAPGTYSNAAAATPFLAGERWRTEPVELGLRPDPVPADRPLPPLPHT